MRNGVLWLSLFATTTQASQPRSGTAPDPHLLDGFANLFAQTSAEPKMMVALAAGTVLIQFVRKYRTHRPARRMLEHNLPQDTSPAGPEG